MSRFCVQALPVALRANSKCLAVQKDERKERDKEKKNKKKQHHRHSFKKKKKQLHTSQYGKTVQVNLSE